MEFSLSAESARAIAIAAVGRRLGVFGALRFVVVWVVTAAFLSACLVDNPAYDPTVNGPIDGGAIDGLLILDGDGFVLQPMDAEELPPLDTMAAPFDTAEATPLDASVVQPPDAAVVQKLDAAVVPTPDAAMVKLDAAVVPPPDAALVNKTCASDPNLLLCIDFENNTARDLSATALNLNTSSLKYEAGPSGTALLSSASTRITNVNTTRLGVTAVTIQAWIKPAGLPAAGRRFGIIDYQPQYALFVMPDGSLVCGCDPINTLTSAPVIKTGVWQSVACTMTDSGFAIWVDGVAVAKMVPTGGFCVSGLNAVGLTVLGNLQTSENPNADQFEGSADNVRVWRRARTASEICSDALACKAP